MELSNLLSQVAKVKNGQKRDGCHTSCDPTGTNRRTACPSWGRNHPKPGSQYLTWSDIYLQMYSRYFSMEREIVPEHLESVVLLGRGTEVHV